MKLLVFLAAYVPVAVLRGWVISLLWGWYVADYFGLRTLTIVEAVGLGIFASLFTARAPTQEDVDRPAWWDLMYMVMFPALALLFGWLWSFVR